MNLSCVIVYCFLFKFTASIYYGQRMPIQSAPFIVYGEGTYSDKPHQFSGVIISEILVLTHSDVIRTYQHIKMYVGVGDKKRCNDVAYEPSRMERNGYVGIIEIKNAVFQFGIKVQQASLSSPTMELVTKGRVLLVSGYGYDRVSNTGPMLRRRRIFVDYEKVLDDDKPYLFTMADHRWETNLGNGNLGGPVWDVKTGEVVGLIKTTRLMWSGRVNHQAVTIGPHRKWIARIKMKWDAK